MSPQFAIKNMEDQRFIYELRSYFVVETTMNTYLKNSIEKMDRTKLSSSEEEELKKLEALIYDGKEDCNVIMIGKLK